MRPFSLSEATFEFEGIKVSMFQGFPWSYCQDNGGGKNSNIIYLCLIINY